MDDKVSDVMAVLTVMRRKFKGTSNYCNFTELRKEAVGVVAETEYSKGRYKNQLSARETINDAYSRRLKLSRAKFDGLTEQWLRHNSMQLKNILLRHSKSPSQSDEVTIFFEEEN